MGSDVPGPAAVCGPGKQMGPQSATGTVDAFKSLNKLLAIFAKM